MGKNEQKTFAGDQNFCVCVYITMVGGLSNSVPKANKAAPRESPLPPPPPPRHSPLGDRTQYCDLNWQLGALPTDHACVLLVSGIVLLVWPPSLFPSGPLLCANAVAQQDVPFTPPPPKGLTNDVSVACSLCATPPPNEWQYDIPVGCSLPLPRGGRMISTPAVAIDQSNRVKKVFCKSISLLMVCWAPQL